MKTVTMKDYMISASVSCMDLCNLEQSVCEVEKSGVSFYHYDMVDGEFNNCFILSETLLQQMKKITNLPIEAHLAAYNPEKYIEMYAKAGADYIAVHYEAMKEPDKIFDQIRHAGAVPVLAYKSTTAPRDDFTELASKVPWVLKLTVNPGFSGQKMQEGALEHIRLMRERLDKAGLRTKIQADGNINVHTIPKAVKAGADILTGGTSGLFLNGTTVSENYDQMMQAVEKK